MKKQITFLKTMLLAVLLLVGNGMVWGQTTYTFSSKSWAASPADWTSKKDGLAYLKSQGIQITTGATGACGNSPISFSNVTSVKVGYSTNSSKGVGTINVFSVADANAAAESGTRIGTSTSVSTTGGTTERYLTFNTTAVTGNIQIYVTCTTNSIYINSVEITYSTATPDIALANNGTQVTTANVNQGTSAVVLHKFQLGVTTGAATLTGMTCTTNGTYAAADITNLKVRYSADATLDGADATLSTYTNPGAAGAKTFPSFSNQAISKDATGYVFITADVAAGATHNNTIGLNAITTSDLTFSSANLTGSTTAGGVQTFTDVTAPTVSSYSPADGNTAVTINQNLILTFSESVKAGTSGSIDIYNTAGLFETIPYNDSRITFSTNTVTINPTGTFVYGANYYVQISGTAITDNVGNAYAGIANATTWNFTTIAPSVSNVTSPNANGTYKVGDVITVEVTFTDNVIVTGSPYILLKMVGTNRQASYLSGSGTNVLTFSYTLQSTDANTDLDYATTSSLSENGGTIKSADGITATRTLASPGAANSLGSNKNIVVDCVGPTVSTYSPTDGNATVTVTQNLVLTFNENVKLGTLGSIVIYNLGGTEFENIPYNDSRITFATNTVTINPTGTFAYSSDYYVQISGKPIVDEYDNSYGGISDATTWNFTTECGPVTLPYSQDFSTFPPNSCWTQKTGLLGTPSTLTGTSSAWTADGFANSGTTGSARINIYGTSAKEWLITPTIDLGSTTDYQLEFDLALTAYNTTTNPATTGTDDKFAVVISTDNGVTWTSANTLRVWNNSGSTDVYNNLTPVGTHVTISLADYTGWIKIGFYGESTESNADNDLFIDNLSVVQLATCISPTIVASSSVTETTATISWTASSSNPTNGYQYEVRTSGTAGSGATGLVTSGTVAAGVVSKDITDLNPNTSYNVYVRADCGGDDFSVWTNEYNFSTLELSAPVATAATDITANSFTANWNAVSGAENYKIDVATVSNFGYSSKLSENFSGFTTNNGSSDRSSNLDTYLQTTGWKGAAIYEMEGYTKMGSGSNKGIITTPTIDLSDNSGKATLIFDLMKYGSDATIVQIFHATDGITFNQIGSDITAPESLTTQTISITGGTVNSKIRIAAKNVSNYRFYLDNLNITQENTTAILSGYNNLTVSNTTQTVTGLEPNTNYYFRVRAYKGSNTSTNSNIISVTTFPTEISTNVNASTLPDCSTCDLVVANGGVLTIDVTGKTYKDITVESGGKLNTTQALTLTNLIVKAVKDVSSFSSKLDAGITASSVKLYKTIDDVKWYYMAFPSEVTVANITKSDGSSVGTLGTDWFIKYYDGAQRGLSGTGSNWKHIGSTLSLTANVGYIFGLKTGTVELSIPLNTTLLAAESAPKSISVAANNGSADASNHGWNLIGHPYMSIYNAQSNATAPNFMIMPNVDGKTFEVKSKLANELPTALKPFEAYFVQADGNSSISFALNGRQNAPASVAASTQDIVKLNLTTATASDYTYLIMDNDQTTGYQIGEDMVKWLGTGTDIPQVYTMLGNISYAFNALPMNSVINLPIGFYTKNEGASIIHVDAARAPGLSKLLLNDKVKGITTDLLTSDYNFDATAGTDNARFVITAQRVSTGNNILIENGPRIVNMQGKLILNDLSANSTIRVYDAIGRMIVNRVSMKSSIEISLQNVGMYVVRIDSGAKNWTVKVIND